MYVCIYVFNNLLQMQQKTGTGFCFVSQYVCFFCCCCYFYLWYYKITKDGKTSKNETNNTYIFVCVFDVLFRFNVIKYSKKTLFGSKTHKHTFM